MNKLYSLLFILLISSSVYSQSTVYAVKTADSRFQFFNKTTGQKVNDLKKKGKPVITCCASGMRSSSAASILKQAGVEAYNGGSWGGLQNKIS